MIYEYRSSGATWSEAGLPEMIHVSLKITRVGVLVTEGRSPNLDWQNSTDGASDF